MDTSQIHQPRRELHPFFFFWLHPQYAEVPRPGIKPTPQWWQHQILNLVSHQGTPHCNFFFFKVLNQTCNLMVTSRIRFHCATMGTPHRNFWHSAFSRLQGTWVCQKFCSASQLHPLESAGIRGRKGSKRQGSPLWISWSSPYTISLSCECPVFFVCSFVFKSCPAFPVVISKLSSLSLLEAGLKLQLFFSSSG